MAMIRRLPIERDQSEGPAAIETKKHEFYRAALRALNASGLPYLVGGGHSLEYLTGIFHPARDLDIFVRRNDCPRALTMLARNLGCQIELSHPHWLAKAWRGDCVIDVIFSTGNGQAHVDDNWLEHGLPAEVLGVFVRLCPLEETLWTKAFIMERERYDGADVAHLIRACAHRIDWERLLRLFGANWSVLLSHVSLFRYIYPGERDLIPRRVMHVLTERLAAEDELAPGEERLCRGPLLSRGQYVVDVEDWDYQDGRLYPFGRMTAGDAKAWSAAAERVPRMRRTQCPCCLAVQP